MNVLYTCDNNYVWLMGISMISLFENNKRVSEICVYLLGQDISDTNKSFLKDIACEYSRKIIVMDVPKLDLPNSLISSRWPLSAFTRLYSGELLSEDLERILYLDCDTIVTGSISEFEKIDISKKIFFGVKDCIGKNYKKNIGLDAEDEYINAGVLLINLKELRKINIKVCINDYMKEYKKLINYADQDLLNGVFHGKIGILDARYNVMSITVTHTYEEIQLLRRPTSYYTKEEVIQAIKNPAIIHYTTNMRIIRPWYENTNHPLALEFLKYKEKSPWRTRIISEMNFDSRESKFIKIIQMLPCSISYFILGIMHAWIKPLFIRYRAIASFK